MSKESPTARSLKHLRTIGWHACKVEQRLPRCFITKDAFNFGDLLACHPNGKPTLIQVTSGSNVAARITKAKAHAGPLVAWLLSGGRLLVHGWRKVGPRGERKTWQLREIELTLMDLTDPAAPMQSATG